MAQDLRLATTKNGQPLELVHGVNLELRRGQIMAVVGSSGSGKSLTCLALLGLAPPSLRVSGSVRFGGIDLLQAGRETVRGIRGMLEKDAYCVDILVQVAAANSALNSFSKELLAQHISTCVADDLRAGSEAKLDELMNLLPKLMK